MRLFENQSADVPEGVFQRLPFLVVEFFLIDLFFYLNCTILVGNEERLVGNSITFGTRVQNVTVKQLAY